jgi:hypothetical protein
VNTKLGNDFAAIGDKVEGDLNQTAHGLRFKKSYSKGGGSNGKGDYRSPEQIMRGYCHTHALKYWELKHAADPAFAFASWADYTKVVDLFYADIQDAKAAAK